MKKKIWDKNESYLECIHPDDRAEMFAKDYYEEDELYEDEYEG